MTALAELAVELEDIVKRTRRALHIACALDDANQLGEAARIADELARGIACLAGARNAASYEVTQQMELSA